MDCNVKRNEEDLIEPCPVENIESDTTGEIQTLPTEGLPYKAYLLKYIIAHGVLLPMNAVIFIIFIDDRQLTDGY